MIRKKQKFLSSRWKRRRKKILFRTILYFVFVVSIILGLSSLSRAEFLSLKEIRIKGNEVLGAEEIRAIVVKETSKSFLKIFSRSNIFLYPGESIEAEILKKYKRASEAEVSLKGFSDLEIIIKERKPIGLWCGEESREMAEIEIKERESCFFLDETGYIFEAVGEDRVSENFPKYFSADVQIADLPGEYILITEDFQELNEFFTLLATLAVHPQKVFLNYPQAQVVFDKNFKLIFDLSDDLKKTFENLVTLISEPEFQKSEPFFIVFEYIDLGFGNKLLYKLR